MLLGDVAAMTSRSLPFSTVWIDAPWQTGYNTFVVNDVQLPNFDDSVATLTAHGLVPLVWATEHINTSDDSDQMVGMPAFGSQTLFERFAEDEFAQPADHCRRDGKADDADAQDEQREQKEHPSNVAEEDHDEEKNACFDHCLKQDRDGIGQSGTRWREIDLVQQRSCGLQRSNCPQDRAIEKVPHPQASKEVEGKDICPTVACKRSFRTKEIPKDEGINRQNCRRIEKRPQPSEQALLVP
jgi:hypothetical protein